MEIKRIRCKDVATGRIRMIVEPLATNLGWMKKKGLIIQEIEKPKIIEVEEPIEVFNNTADIFETEVEKPIVKKTRNPRTKK